MTLKKREKMLLAAVGAVVATIAAVWLLTGSGGAGATVPTAELRRQCEAKQAELDKKLLAAKSAARNQATLAAWEKESLPSQTSDARTAYQAWLRGLVDKLKFQKPEISAPGDQPGKGIYTKLTFHIKARATLDQLTRFLYEFYASQQLHQVRHLDLLPGEGVKDFEVSLDIEALSLPTADRKDKLATARVDRLAKGTGKDYVDTIVRRRMEGDRFVDAQGVFTPYSPPPPPKVAVRHDPPKPPPPPPPKPPSFDHSPYVVVTGITEVDGEPQVWLDVKTLGKKFQLKEGEKFQAGDVSGTIARIRPHEVEIVVGGQRRLVPNGGNLHDAKTLQ